MGVQMSIKKTFSDEFKAKVALDALKGNKTVAELSSEHQVHATQINNWRGVVKEGTASLFGNNNDKKLKEKDELIEQLYLNIGQLQVDVTWLKKKLKI
jgi:putative transposase